MHVPYATIVRTAFKAYDIRGRSDTEIHPYLAWRLGQVLGQRWQGRTVVVGHDARLNSPLLAQALIQGLRQVGANVHFIGLAPSPLLYFAALKSVGIMITASHNPPQDNGFKLVEDGKPLYGATLQQLYEAIMQAPGLARSAPMHGQLDRIDPRPAYAQALQARVQLQRPIRVVVDAGNGAAAGLASTWLQQLGAQVVPLFDTPDGRFPNRSPDPSHPQHLQALATQVQRTGAELGLAFDGDADRLAVVNHQGRFIWTDQLLAFFAQQIMPTYPGRSVVFDIKCSRHLRQRILDVGALPCMVPTGHPFIKEGIAANNGIFGGEMSGHFIFAKAWYAFDDGIFAAAYLLALLSHFEQAGQALSAIPCDISTPELNIAITEAQRPALQAQLEAWATQPSALLPQAEICALDGLRADYPDGFGLLRLSNTSTTMTLRLEGETPDALQRIGQDFGRLIQALGLVDPFPIWWAQYYTP